MTGGFGFFGEHGFGLGFGDGFRIEIFGDFEIIATTWTLDVGAVGTVDNHDFAKIGDDGGFFGGVKILGVGESDGVGVERFDGDIVIPCLEIWSKRTAGGDEFGAVGGGADGAREGGKGELGEGLL